MPRNKFNQGSERCTMKTITLLKETEEDTNKWRDILCSSFTRVNIIRISMVPKAIHSFNAISIQISMAFFTEKGKDDPKICRKPQKTPNSESSHEKEKARCITLPDFKVY